MSVAVISHMPIDHIEAKGKTTASTGGPPSYCGLTARELGFGVKLATKIGSDFPEDYRRFLGGKGLPVPDSCISDKSPSTRFKLVLRDDGRDLFLLARCEDFTAEDTKLDADACIVSPVINEIAEDLLPEIRKRTGFLFLDPQGFVRRVVGKDKRICLARREMNLERDGVNAVKMDEEEAVVLTGTVGLDALKKLRVEIAILTGMNKILMLHNNDRLYEMTLPNAILVRDTTGMGDIAAAAYTCAFAREADAVWALCSATAAPLAALHTGEMGISKIPAKRDVEALASSLLDKVKVTYL